jgi:hypothetical protein
MKEKNIRELAKRMGLITVENMCQYTIAQLVVMVANKVNELVNEVWRFETDVQEILKTQNEKIQYLLGEGLHLEVATLFEKWMVDGTFETLINQTLFKQINERTGNKIGVDKIGVNMYLYKTTSQNDVDIQLEDIKNCGFNSVFICVYHTYDNYIITPYISDSLISYTIKKAKTLGIKNISIKLHIDGGISLNPSDKNLFFSRWKERVMNYANLLKANSLSELIISNEMSVLTKGNYDNWLDIIQSVQALDIKVGASYQGFKYVYESVINDLLDVIAVNTYPALTNKGYDVSHNKATSTIYNKTFDELKYLKSKYPSKDITVSEIGCTRNVDSLSKPYGWEFDTQEQSFEPQKIYYKAILSTLCATPNLLTGVYFWSTDDKTKINSFSPFGNSECEDIIKSFLKGVN